MSRSIDLSKASNGDVSPLASLPRPRLHNRNPTRAVRFVLLACLLMGSPVSAAMPPPDLGDLQVTPMRIPTGSPVKVTATVRIPDSVLKESGPLATLTLHRLDVKSRLAVAALVDFHDDGTNGDDKAGDGLYTAQATLNAKKASTIVLAAIATFKDPYANPTSSLYAFLEARPGVSLTGPWAVVDGERVVFRGKDGATVSEEKASDMATPKPVKKPTQKTAKQTAKKVAAAAQPDGPLFKFDQAITSPDRTHVGIIGSLQPNPKDGPPSEESPSPSGWEFRYQDSSGLLWSKVITDPERHFYSSSGSNLISENGGRVALLEVGETDIEPVLWVYNQAGALLLEEKVDLLDVQRALVSPNGRYLLLKGMPSVPTEDLVKLIVIDLDSPTVRWSEIYHGAQVESEGVYDNDAGGFDVVLNDVTRYRFPR